MAEEMCRRFMCVCDAVWKSERVCVYVRETERGDRTVVECVCLSPCLCLFLLKMFLIITHNPLLFNVYIVCCRN